MKKKIKNKIETETHITRKQNEKHGAKHQPKRFRIVFFFFVFWWCCCCSWSFITSLVHSTIPPYLSASTCYCCCCFFFCSVVFPFYFFFFIFILLMVYPLFFFVVYMRSCVYEIYVTTRNDYTNDVTTAVCLCQKILALNFGFEARTVFPGLSTCLQIYAITTPHQYQRPQQIIFAFSTN